MIIERIYTPADLHHGKCEWCGKECDEIISTGDGEICVDCSEAEMFYKETMKGI